MARKILLADDSVTAQNMGRKILADAGYEVITVNNGSAALKKIAEIKPDVIVLDVYMPGYSGLEVCQRLKEVPETGRIPVLLTVGKLEPFKPEEAKRVKAESYIVKPFEASELLSALSKLEDKIVPRSESGKSGRFARAIAAVEEASRGEAEGTEEDGGWKSRISFPKKKKKREQEESEDGDDPAIYNAVNKDLKTVVPHGEAPASPGGETAARAQSTADVSALAPAEFPKDVTLEEIAAIAAAAAQVQAATTKDSVETVPAATPEPQETKPAAEAVAEVNAVAKESEASVSEEAPSATFADVKHEAEPEFAVSGNASQPVEAPAVPMADAAVASEDAKVEAVSAVSAESSAAEKPVEAPVTIASATAVGATVSGPRWTAVAVAIDAAEAANSLEEEMRKAQDAVAVAAAVAAEPVAEVPTPTVVSEPIAEPVAAVDSAPRATAEEEAKLAEALSAVASAPVIEASSPKPEESAPTEAETSSQMPAVIEEPARVEEEAKAEEPVVPEPVVAEAEEPAIRESAEESLPAPGVAQVVSSDAVSSPSIEERQAAEPAPAVAEASFEPAVGGTEDMAAKREKELAESTAAAWASWRQIRKTDGKTEPAKSGSVEEAKASFSEPAAMAVAAGAESAPEDAKSEPAEIANIVDSVLADLRPKIVEEIAKKLGKK